MARAGQTANEQVFTSCLRSVFVGAERWESAAPALKESQTEEEAEIGDCGVHHAGQWWGLGGSGHARHSAPLLARC